MMNHLVYLHGFASGPSGNKGRHCQTWATARGIAFHAPDLNLPDFEHLMITAQIAAVEALLAALEGPVVMVGSSLGGLVGAAVVHRGARPRHLILLAPAFGFARRRLVGPRWAGYRKRGSMPVFHHAYDAWVRLGPALLTDLPAWQDDATWDMPTPTSIIHGLDDEAVPIAESRAFAAARAACRLLEVADDHSLLKPETLHLLDGMLEEAFSRSRE